jgi:hypothetical protein
MSATSTVTLLSSSSEASGSVAASGVVGDVDSSFFRFFRLMLAELALDEPGQKKPFGCRQVDV